MFRRVTLEMSLKPFRKTDEPYMREVCRKLFTQWAPLVRGREIISVMLWTADGSEILDYTGNPDDAFEWCYFLGTANGPLRSEDEPKEIGLHERKQLYCDKPPVFTYRLLAQVVRVVKEVGAEFFPSSRIEVGETFDIGPEFAISDFKYRRHREICSGSGLDNCKFVDACALLNGDDHAYAAYPDGIPDGTPFGTFLGKQSAIFLKDMGFDFLWLSNGLGFSAEPWSEKGKIFDGTAFHPERLSVTRGKVFEFWKLFREACPDIPLQTRGTNYSVGIDYASDGVPLHDIYHAGFDLLPPPNSPWAALNGNFGLELMGHMTRIADIPGSDYLFRYYVHDPWWVNSPWYDRYEGYPHDIYLPMALSRLDEEGKPQSATVLNLLSVDTSYGTFPEACVNEPLPHLLKAEKDAPDAPAPLIWVYPVREYSTTEEAGLLADMYDGDRFISAAITAGLPLSGVVSTDIFRGHAADIYRRSILLSPAPVEPAVADKLNAMADAGVPVLLYARPAEFPRLRKLCPKAVLLSMEGDPAAVREALVPLGYTVSFEKVDDASLNPVIMLHRYDSALMLSAFAPDTTVDTLLSCPAGAPVFLGGETQVTGRTARYRFGRAEHKEGRVFVEQERGVVSARETCPVNARFRRHLRVSGLKDATVRFFPETGTFAMAGIALRSPDMTPVSDPRFVTKTDELGTYLYAEHIDGMIELYME